MSAALQIVADGPPHNIELEQALLGAILVNNEAFYRVADFVEPQHFFEPVHQQLFKIAGSLVRVGKTATPVTLKTFLPGDLVVSGLTINQYLARLAAEATTVINAADYGRSIFELWRVRDFLDIAQDVKDGRKRGDEPDASLQFAFERIDELRSAGVEHAGTMRSAGHAVAELMAYISEVYRGTATDDAIKTGLRDLDERTGGLKRGELIVMAGRPGMGKTAVAGTIARMASRLGHGVAFFSLEMASRPIMARLQADEMFDDRLVRPITVNRIIRADITPQEFDRMADAARAIHALPLVIDDAPQATIGTVYAKVRAVKKRFARDGKRLDLVIIDYLKFLRASDRYYGQRHYEVGEITASLKALAKDLEVAVLLLAQLNRQVEARTDKRPQLADLRESGDIEADADVVMLLFREAYYLQTDPEIGTDPGKMQRLEEVANTLEIIIAKQRMGAVCTVECCVNLECSAVRDLGGVR